MVGDVLVPEGVTLTVAPGARISFAADKRSRIVVRGTLIASGEEKNPIVFGSSGSLWEGLIFLGTGRRASSICWTDFFGAQTSVSVSGDCKLQIEQGRLRGGLFGLRASGSSAVELRHCEIQGAGIAAIAGYENASVEIMGSRLTANVCGLRLTDRARIKACGSSIDNSGRHGAWLHGRSCGKFEVCIVEGSGANGIYLTGAAELNLCGGVVRKNRGGLTCEKESRTEIKETRFFGNININVSLLGGHHSLEKCVVENAPIGIKLNGDASIALSESVINDCSRSGILLAGRSRVRMIESQVSACGDGAMLEDSSEFTAQDVSFSSCAVSGLLLREKSRAILRGCSLETNHSGVIVVGDAALEMATCVTACNHIGLEGREGSTIVSKNCQFNNNDAAQIRLLGGKHSFLGCGLDGGTQGLSAAGDVELSLVDCRIVRHENVGVVLGGRSQTTMQSGSCQSNGLGMRVESAAVLNARQTAFSNNRDHGVWLKDAAKVGMNDCRCLHNTSCGFYLTGEASLEFVGGTVSNNRVGFSCDDETTLHASNSSLLNNDEAAFSFLGGDHRLNAMRSEGSRVGLALHRDSKAVMKRSAFSRHEHGVFMTGKSEANLNAARFSNNSIAVFITDDGSAAMSNCVFWKNPTGLKADGRGTVELNNNRISRSSLDGIWIGAKADIRIRNNSYASNRIDVLPPEGLLEVATS